jgi:imidazolonepropionase-like amidohydrolase
MRPAATVRIFICASVAVALSPCLLSGVTSSAGAAATFVIRGAKIYSLAGPPLDRGSVVIQAEKIVAVGRDITVPKGAQIIDARGLEVYPGLIDAFSDLGLREIISIAGTDDTSELGSYNPQLSAATAINPDSALIPVARSNGITHALSVPGYGGAPISGQAAAINLAGWTADEMLIRRSVAMVATWPGLDTRAFDFATFTSRQRPYSDAKREYEKAVATFGEWIDRARYYSQTIREKSPNEYVRDLRLEALVPVVRGELPLLVVAIRQRDIRNAVEFCDKQRIKMILGGGFDAWKVKDLLKAKNIPVILGSPYIMPPDEDAGYDDQYSNPGILSAAGVKIAFGSFDGSFSRRIPYYAGSAVPYGLPHDEALRAVTIYPAQILGIEDQFGTIEPGKIANLIVTTGDPLDIPTEVRYLFIKGKLIDTDNKQRQLYEKYRKGIDLKDRRY